MKQSRIRKYLITAVGTMAALALFSGCGNETTTHTTIDNVNNTYTASTGANDGANTNTNANTTQTQEPFQAPDDLPNPNVSVLNISHEDVAVDPRAMSIEDAARVGAQYIMDVFGVDIDGMYIEFDFSDWDSNTRILWHGAVSVSNRNTLQHRVRTNELNDEFMARLEAGEDGEDIREEMTGLFEQYSYVHANFYFVIDAISGQRIDLWRPFNIQTNHEATAFHYYVEDEWAGDWSSAFDIEVTQQDIDNLTQMAREYAQRHFNSTAVVSVEYSSSFATFIYVGDGSFRREASLVFGVTDETGRLATITIHRESQTVTNISTMSNDFIPMDFDHYDGESMREIVREDDADVEEAAEGEDRPRE